MKCSGCTGYLGYSRGVRFAHFRHDEFRPFVGQLRQKYGIVVAKVADRTVTPGIERLYASSSLVSSAKNYENN